jgi:hypothetical protein
MRAPWIVVVVVGCTQPAPASEAAGAEELVAAAEKIDAAATKLETAAATLEQSVRALEAMRAEQAEADRLDKQPREIRPRPAPLPGGDGEVAPTTSPIPGAAEAVACPSEGKCTIQRTFIDTLAGNPALLAKQMRIVPSQKDGKVEGMKLFGIRRGSLPALLGFQNGDTIVRIAEHDLTSAEDALAIYSKLRDFDRLTIDFVRRGEPLLLEIAAVE